MAGTEEQDRELAKLFAQKFIARPDVYAIQHTDGSWQPVQGRNHDGSPGEYLRIGMPQLLDHINGRKSYGHYLLSEKDECKFFAFDIDLEKPLKTDNPAYQPILLPSFKTGTDWRPESFEPGNPREVWANPRALKVQRQFLTHQLRTIANRFAREIWQLLNIPVAISYSGSKGMHVYGFTGLVPAEVAREGALMVIESMGTIEPLRGNNFFRHKQSEVADPVADYPQLSIEVFPKQGTLNDGKKLGNLMRLPTGINLKGDRAYFIDMRDTRTVDFEERDPIEALTTADPWQGYL